MGTPEVSRQLTVVITRPVGVVCEFLSDPWNWTRWAAGLSETLTFSDGHWEASAPAGTVLVRFSPPNEFGVFDHWVTAPGAPELYIPLRVTAFGDSSEVILTLRSAPGDSAEYLDEASANMTADLGLLKAVLESPRS